MAANPPEITPKRVKIVFEKSDPEPVTQVKIIRENPKPKFIKQVKIIRELNEHQPTLTIPIKQEVMTNAVSSQIPQNHS